MPTVEASGTLAASGAEDTLATISDNRSLLLVVDLDNMQAGDTVVLRWYRKVLSSGSLVLYIEETFTGANGGNTEPVVASIPLSSPHQARATLEQTVGTLRNFDYSIESL